MEQTVDVRALIEKGDALLKELRVSEAAAEYARAAQIDPNAVGAHLGLAEANMALGQYGIVAMACQTVERLAPNTADAYLAQAIDATLARRYDAALAALDRVVELDPPRAYAHALRGYILRQLRQSYDASLAESKAARLSGTHDLKKLFPPVNPVVPEVFATPAAPPQPAPQPVVQPMPRPWSERSGAERAATRARFVTRNVPIVTYTLIAINVAIYLACVALSGFDFFSPAAHPNVIYSFGVEFGLPVYQNDPTQWYRVFTAMFLHLNLTHIGFNMLSLYFIGVITERLIGPGRFIVIYMVSGIVAGVAQAFFLGAFEPSLGASGAIFGIFGALGVIFLLYRRSFGPAGNSMISQWLFWLVLNIVLDFTLPGIGVVDHIAGLLTGMALAVILLPSLGHQRR